MTLPGWRALGSTWAGVLALVVGGGLWLERLGPLPVAPGTAATAADEAPPLGPGPTPSQPLAAAAPEPSPAAVGPGAGPAAVASNVAPQATVAPVGNLQAAAPAGALPLAEGATRPPGGETGRATPPVTAAADTPPPRAAPRGMAGLDASLTEPGPHGPLPRISADGRTPIRAYGRPFDRSDTRPRIAIIVGDFGLNAAQSDDALRRLPPAVSLVITPYGYGLAAWSERARERGAETLVAIPMEPAGFPTNNPGDRALLINQSLPENLDRLAWALSRTQGYVGAIGAIGNMRGERFASTGAPFAAVQDSLQGRGLLYIDPRPGARGPARAWGRAVDVIIDEPATGYDIDRRLSALEGLARGERGSALGLAGSPTPVLVNRIAAWAATLDAKGLVLAPASVLIRRPEAIAAPEPTSRTP